MLSIHSVASAGEVLDGLGTEGLLDAGPRRCECVLHWFSGSSDELWRAIRAGCWFSVGERMTSTRRGREYCRLIPSGRLLLETDLPEVPGASCPVGSIPSSLARAVSALASIRGASADDIAHVTTENAEGLLARDGGLAQHAEGADPAPAR